MPEETPASPASAPASTASPVPDVKTTTAPASEPVASQDDMDSAALEAIKHGATAETAEKRVDEIRSGKKPAPPSPGTSEAEEKPAGEAPVEPKAAEIPEEDKQVLKRFQLDETDAPTDPAKRTKFIENLRTRAADQDRMYREYSAMRQQIDQGKAPTDPNVATPNQAPPQPGAHWKSVEEFMGPDGIKPLQSAFEAELSPYRQAFQTIAPLIQSQQQAVEMQNRLLVHLLEEKGLSSAQWPEGVDGTSADNLAKVREEAQRIVNAEAQRLGDKYDYLNFNHSHAIPKAVAALYSKEINTAKQKAARAGQQAAIKGSPDPGNRSPSMKAAMSEDERDNLAYELAKAGKTKELAELSAA